MKGSGWKVGPVDNSAKHTPYQLAPQRRIMNNPLQNAPLGVNW